jgi:hypothetical protein
MGRHASIAEFQDPGQDAKSHQTGLPGSLSA